MTAELYSFGEKMEGNKWVRSWDSREWEYENPKLKKAWWVAFSTQESFLFITTRTQKKKRLFGSISFPFYLVSIFVDILMNCDSYKHNKRLGESL